MLKNYTKQERNFYLLLIFLWIGCLLVLYVVPLLIGAKQTTCPIKALTTIPCPGCGTGHGILNILQFKLIEAWQLNPFSFLLLPIIASAPFVIIYDLACKTKHLYLWARQLDKFIFKHKWIFYLLLLLILINWILKLIQHFNVNSN